MFAAFESEKSQSESKLGTQLPPNFPTHHDMSSIGVYLLVRFFCMYVVRAYDDVDESSTEESSGPPSPLLHKPYIPDELADRADIRAAFREAEATYKVDKGQVPSFLIIIFFSKNWQEQWSTAALLEKKVTVTKKGTRICT